MGFVKAYYRKTRSGKRVLVRGHSKKGKPTMIAYRDTGGGSIAMQQSGGRPWGHVPKKITKAEFAKNPNRKAGKLKRTPEQIRRDFAQATGKRIENTSYVDSMTAALRKKAGTDKITFEM